MFNTHSTITTPHAEKLIRRLSKHWAHKLNIIALENGAIIEFDQAQCTLLAEENNQLLAKIESEAIEKIEHYEQVVANHLHRMNAANGDELVIDWQRDA